jgi:hypothetical protein
MTRARASPPGGSVRLPAEEDNSRQKTSHGPDSENDHVVSWNEGSTRGMANSLRHGADHGLDGQVGGRG